MRTQMTATKPDDIDFTLTISMRLGEWKDLREEISKDGHTGWKLRSAITGMIIMAQSKFEPEAEK